MVMRERGDLIDIELLRSESWVAEYEAVVGDTIELDLPEFGAFGLAEVVAIDPCPPIQTGPGSIVTGTFVHTVDEVVEVRVEGLDDAIGCTANHPFWSEDRQEFVAAGDLSPGERLRTAQDTTQRVQSVVRRAGTQRVYNLEVQGEHVYYVSRSGVLVHNVCVYQEIRRGKVKYVGITKNFRSRAAQHLRNGRAVEMLGGLPNMTRKQARAVEHLLIQKYGRQGIDKRGTLANVNRGIDPRKLYKYKKELRQADKWIEELGL